MGTHIDGSNVSIEGSGLEELVKGLTSQYGIVNSDQARITMLDNGSIYIHLAINAGLFKDDNRVRAVSIDITIPTDYHESKPIEPIVDGPVVSEPLPGPTEASTRPILITGPIEVSTGISEEPSDGPLGFDSESGDSIDGVSCQNSEVNY
jgi:hypothetical protein